MKKIVCSLRFIIAAIALLVIAKGTVMAADVSLEGYTQIASGKCGKNVTYKVYVNPEEDYKTIVSGTGPTYNYNDDGVPLYQKWDVGGGYFQIGADGDLIVEKGITRIGNNFCADITPRSVSLPEGLKSIGKCAFKDVQKPELIIIPNTVTTIETGAFENCTNLRSVTIPDSVSTIGSAAFASCFSIKTLTLGKGLKTIGADAFSSCDNLTSVNIPDNVTTIHREAFSACFKLKTVQLSSSLTELPYDTFGSCGFTKFIFPKNSKVKTIGKECFTWCRSLKNITLSKSVKEIKKEAFRHCTKLRVITLPGKKPPKINSRDVFPECNTKKITIKCPNMSKASKNKLLKQLKKTGFKGKVI